MVPATHTMEVITPDGAFIVECPTFLGEDAAKRRVTFAFMARGHEPEDIEVYFLYD